MLDVEDESLTIKITLNAGHGMNYHSHENRDEVWTVISGTGRAILDGRAQPVKEGYPDDESRLQAHDPG